MRAPPVSLENFELPEPTDPDECPPPKPSLITKYDIYSSDAYFAKVDNHAIEISKKEFSTFKEFIWHLVYSKDFTELEIARVCFRWLTVKDMKSITFNDIPEESPEYVLTGFTRFEGSYPRIYEILCSFSGLQVILLNGYAKGADYTPGEDITRRAPNHSWTAVYIDQNWFIIDPHWAMRYINAETMELNMDPESIHENIDDLVYEYDDFYFLMDPAKTIYSHFPEDPSWQLSTTPPLSETVFTSLPVTKTQFFRSGMNFKGNHNGILRTKNGELKLSLGYNSCANFYFKLEYYFDHRLVRKHNNITVSDYSIQESLKDCITLYFRLPFKGEYLLTIYSMVNVKHAAVPNTYRAACLYKMICDKPSENLIIYPGCPDTNWGPSWTHLSFYDITALNLREGIVFIPNAVPAYVEAHFRKQRSDVNVLAKLRQRIPGTPLDKAEFEYIDQQIEEMEENHSLVFTVRLPSAGYYGLEIYANEPNDADTFTHVTQYLIDFFPGGISALKSIPEIDDPCFLPNPYLFCPLETPSQTNLDTATNSLNPVGLPLGESSSSGSVSDDKQAAIKGAFDQIDQDAIEVSLRDQASFKQLMDELIHSKNLTTDIDKIRAVFLWLCTKNLNDITFDKVEEDSPESVLMGIKDASTTYAQVFQVLCYYIQVPCKIIHGYAKGVDYDPEIKLEGAVAQHAWNAVKVDNKWHLIDCHWAARRLLGKSMDSSNIGYELDNFYFMPTPEQFKHSHLPYEPEWQLLSNPIELETFEKMVPIKSKFFSMGLQFLSHEQSIIDAQDELNILIGFTGNNEDKLAFSFTLTMDGKTEINNGLPYSRYCIQEMQTEEKKVDYCIRFPVPGIYRFVLFARSYNQTMLTAVAEYVIKATTTGKTVIPYPPTQQAKYGPTEVADKLNITSNVKPCIKNSEGSMEILFKSSYPVNDLPIVLGRMKHNNISDEELSNMILVRKMPNRQGGSTIQMTPHIPNPGVYALQLFCNDTEKGPTSFILVWQILFETTGSSPKSALMPPQGEPLGEQNSFQQLKIVPVSHIDPYIEIDPTLSADPSPIDLRVEWDISNAKKSNRIIAQLIRVDRSGTEEDFSSYVLQQFANNIVTFMVRIPSAGFYRLHIFALDVDSPVDEVPVIYTYMIEAPSKQESYYGESVGAFPTQYATWKEDASLIKPLNNRIKSVGDSIPFSLNVPRALAVAVSIKNTWVPLKKVDDSSCVWEGTVNLPKNAVGAKLVVCANYGDSGTKFKSLLEFSVEA